MTCLTLFALLFPATMTAPLHLDLNLKTTGNPFDPAVNNVSVHLSQGSQHLDRIAFFAHGSWHVRTNLPRPGVWSALVMRNGATTGEKLSAKTGPSEMDEIVRAEGRWFVRGGKRFWPLGHNLGWQSPNLPDITTQLATMKENGLNWSRIWCCPWDDKNPWWCSNKPKQPDGYLNEAALDRWDQIVTAAEKNGIAFQWVLFHHGLFSSNVNPNWPDHPWNKKNGGFLDKASDFFINPEAKRRTKLMLRYIMSRWGASSSVMAWELFNEVQFTDMAQSPGGWAKVAQWHDELAEYVKSIDPDHHLVTTSSQLDQPIWNNTDYYQGHGYPPSVAALLLGSTPDPKKPYFYGEVGGQDDADMGAGEPGVIRDAIWGAFFAGHSGAAEYWSWDRMGRPELYAEYRRAAAILKTLGDPAQYKPFTPQVSVPVGGTLVLTPGRGWDKTDLLHFDLPSDATPAKLGRVSGFLQGTGHRDMQAGPLEFALNLPKPSTLRVNVDTASSGGGTVQIRVNGREVVNRVYAPSNGNHRVNAKLEAELPAGAVTVQVENTGSDWVTIRSFDFGGIAPKASVWGTKSVGRAVYRVQTTEANVPVEITGSKGLGIEVWPMDGGISHPVSSLKLQEKSQDYLVVVK